MTEPQEQDHAPVKILRFSEYLDVVSREYAGGIEYMDSTLSSYGELGYHVAQLDVTVLSDRLVTTVLMRRVGAPQPDTDERVVLLREVAAELDGESDREMCRVFPRMSHDDGCGATGLSCAARYLRQRAEKLVRELNGD